MSVLKWENKPFYHSSPVIIPIYYWKFFFKKKKGKLWIQRHFICDKMKMWSDFVDLLLWREEEWERKRKEWKIFQSRRFNNINHKQWRNDFLVDVLIIALSILYRHCSYRLFWSKVLDSRSITNKQVFCDDSLYR